MGEFDWNDGRVVSINGSEVDYRLRLNSSIERRNYPNYEMWITFLFVKTSVDKNGIFCNLIKVEGLDFSP